MRELVTGVSEDGVPDLQYALAQALAQPTELAARVNDGPASTFPTAIAMVELAGELHTLFCKYQGDTDHNQYGHRSGVQYEALVYEHVLSHISSTASRYFGHYVDPRTRKTWLFIEFLEGAESFTNEITRGRYLAAGSWLGGFHRETEDMWARDDLRFLTRYDRPYYEGWIDRTLEFSAPIRNRHPWLEEACEGFRPLVDELLDAPQSIIHGEYYRGNVLFRAGTIYPVDWESAAVAPGEVDLATLTDVTWGSELITASQRAYAQVRWPDGVPDGFARRLALAQVYVHLRWLGDRPEWTIASWRYDLLREAAAALELV